MLTSWRNYVIIALTILCAFLAVRLHFATIELVQFKQASEYAKKKHIDEMASRRLKEQEAAKRAKQSQAHMDKIMNSHPPKECEKLFQWMINPTI